MREIKPQMSFPDIDSYLTPNTRFPFETKARMLNTLFLFIEPVDENVVSVFLKKTNLGIGYNF